MYTAFFFLTKPMQLRICIYKKDHLRIQNCNDMHKHTHKPTHSHHLSVFGNKPKIPAMSSSHVSGNSLQCCCCSFITQIYCLHRRGEFPSIASANQKFFLLLGNKCNTSSCHLQYVGSQLEQFGNSGQTIRNSIKHSWFLWGSWTKSSMHPGICRTRKWSTISPYSASVLTVRWTLWPQSKLYESAHGCWNDTHVLRSMTVWIELRIVIRSNCFR